MLDLIISIVVAIVVANILMGIVGFTMISSKRFLKWYTKKIMKMTTEIQNEMYDEEGL